MKTLKTTIAIALIATTTFFNANAEDKKEDKKLDKNEAAATTANSLANYKMSNLNVGMYEVGGANSLKLNLSLTKDAGKTAIIKLKNEDGVVLNEERVGKKDTAYNFRFDFSETPSGKYFIEITNGEYIITKEILKLGAAQSTLSY